MDALAELVEALLPFEGAAKTEGWIVCFELEHFGHVIACFGLITIRS